MSVENETPSVAVRNPNLRPPFTKADASVIGKRGGRPKTPPEERSARELARQHTALAVATLAQIAGNSKLSPAARVTASTALLDRGWGQPKATLEHQLAQRVKRIITPAPAPTPN